MIVEAEYLPPYGAETTPKTIPDLMIQPFGTKSSAAVFIAHLSRVSVRSAL